MPELLEAVRGGETEAVVTDVGMSAVSDPGCRVVQACIEQGIPSAVAGSGFPVHAFRFLGFLPIKKGERLDRLPAGAG